MSKLDTRQKMADWQKRAEINAPKPGQMAPDFELTELDGETTIRLSDYRGQKPVALVFGSHT